MEHLESGYSDVLSMPTGERRFYLGLIIKAKSQQSEMVENMKNVSQGKGKKTTTISGEALKNKLRGGEIPT